MAEPHRLRLTRLDRVTSTQDEARILARSGSPGGTVVLAEEQTMGRGREGRAWVSPAGVGLWFTLVHRSGRPLGEWPAVTLAAALGLCRALEEDGLDPRVRWPNDVLLLDRKVAGILADTEGTAVLLGMGINVLQEEGDFPPELASRATSVAIACARGGLRPPDREVFLARVLDSLDATLGIFEREGTPALLGPVWERSALRSRRIALRLPSGEIVQGIAEGLGAVGQLLLRTAGGPRTIVSGTKTDVLPEIDKEGP